MDLTISSLIKIIIAVLVIVLLIAGIYLGFKNYIIPYFEGLGPSLIALAFGKRKK